MGEKNDVKGSWWDGWTLAGAVSGWIELSPTVGTSGSMGQGLHDHFQSSTMVEARKIVVSKGERREGMG